MPETRKSKQQRKNAKCPEQVFLEIGAKPVPIYEGCDTEEMLRLLDTKTNERKVAISMIELDEDYQIREVVCGYDGDSKELEKNRIDNRRAMERRLTENSNYHTTKVRLCYIPDSDGQRRLVLVDGWTRLQANRRVGRCKIPAAIIACSEQAALLLASEANEDDTRTTENPQGARDEALWQTIEAAYSDERGGLVRSIATGVGLAKKYDRSTGFVSNLVSLRGRVGPKTTTGRRTLSAARYTDKEFTESGDWDQVAEHQRGIKAVLRSARRTVTNAEHLGVLELALPAVLLAEAGVRPTPDQVHRAAQLATEDEWPRPEHLLSVMADDLEVSLPPTTERSPTASDIVRCTKSVIAAHPDSRSPEEAEDDW